MKSTQQTILVILLVILSVSYLVWLVKKPKSRKSCHHDCDCHQRNQEKTD